MRLGEHNTETEIDCDSSENCIAPFQRVGVDSIVVHSSFDAERSLGIHQHNDIGLIRLDRAITFSNSIQPACLPNVDAGIELVDGMKLTAAGWGHNSTGKESIVYSFHK